MKGRKKKKERKETISDALRKNGTGRKEEGGHVMGIGMGTKTRLEKGGGSL